MVNNSSTYPETRQYAEGSSEMTSHGIGILIDGYLWPPDALLERLRSPEVPEAEFWRCIAYAIWEKRNDEKYMAAINEVKIVRTSTGFPTFESTTVPEGVYEAPPRAITISFDDKSQKVFHDNLDDSQIATELLKVDRYGLGPKQFALIVKEFFTEIGWLINTIDTHFVYWMKSKQIISPSSNDLKHVRRDNKMEQVKENLKNTFQFQNNQKQWEDKDKYYRKDKLGITLNKINNGH